MGDDYDRAEAEAYSMGWPNPRYDEGKSYFSPLEEALNSISKIGDKIRGSNMQTIEQLKAKADAAREDAERYETAIAARAAYGEKDPFKNGTVFKIEMKYRTSNQTFTYAAVKVAGKYYLTGKVQATRTFIGEDTTAMKDGWTWENFVAWLAQGDATVWRARQLEQVL